MSPEKLEEDEVLEEELEEGTEEEELEDRGDILNTDEELEEEEEEIEEEIEEEEESEEDEEGSEEEEEGTEELEEEEETEEEKDVRIPKGRFDQVLHQRDDERKRNAWLEDRLETLIDNQNIPKEEKVDIPEYDFSIKEKEYIDFILEGETDKAIGLRREIDAEKDKQFKKELEIYKEGAEETAKEIQEQEKFNILIDSYEQKYGFLNVDDDGYNEEAVETINALTTSFINKDGLTKSQAIKKAVARLAPMYGNTKKSIKKKALGDRTKESRKRNVKASKQQPPKSNSKRGSNRDLETVLPSKLSEKDFKDLTTKEKSLLRGD